MATNYSLRGHAGKVRYATRKSARKNARLLEQAKRENSHIGAYKCGTCDGYHIGHNNQNPLGTLAEYMPNRQIILAHFTGGSE